MRSTLAALALALLGPSSAASAFSYGESIHGDLSGDRLAPTSLAAAVGSNLLAMTSGSASGSVDRDYFRFTVPDGHRLASITLLTAEVDGAVSFIGLQAGSVFSEPATATNVANLLGWHHFGSSEAGTGTYTFWAQDFGFEARYSMAFGITAIPEPGTLALLVSGRAGIARRRRR